MKRKLGTDPCRITPQIACCPRALRPRRALIVLQESTSEGINSSERLGQRWVTAVLCQP